MAGNKKRVLSSAAHYGFYLLISALMCGITQQYSMGIMTSWVEGHTITGNDIRTVQVRTKHECALHCVSDASCAAAAVYCKLPVGSETFNCELKFGSNLLTYTIVNNSDMCYSIVQSRGEYINGVSVNDISTTSPAVTTTTTIPTTTVSGSATVTSDVLTTTVSGSAIVTSEVLTTTVSGSATSGIRAGIGNLNNMCSGSSSVDIALITDDGVYLYDDMGSLTTGACSGPQAITTIFSGYSGGKALPSVSDIICLMVHQNNDIDMFDNSRVWRWQVQSGNLWSQSAQSYPKDISTHFGVTYSNIPPSNSDWCVNREKNGRQDRFFYNSDMLYFYSTQSPHTDTYAPSTTGKTYNGYNLNPWTQLPVETLVAVISLSTDNDDFVMIGESMTLYRYQMDHTANSNDPPISVTTLGTLVF